MNNIRWGLSAGLMVTSITAFVTNNVADAIYILVMALWVKPKGDA